MHLLLPQLANGRAVLRALGSADWWWVLAALPAVFIAQAFGTLKQIGTIPEPVPFGPTYLVQLGGSFLNMVTPNDVGGMTLTVRYLQKAGVDAGSATACVGMQSLLTTASGLVIAFVFFSITGRAHRTNFHPLRGENLIAPLVVIVAAGVLLAVTPLGRQFLHDRIWPFLRSAGGAIGHVASSPRATGLAIGGAVGVLMVQIVALGLCVHALGAELSFAQVGAAYMGARLVAGVAPVPGGLGAFEAAVIAGLIAFGMAPGPATSAVLIYRVLTFWLNVPLGWVGLRAAEKRGYV